MNRTSIFRAALLLLFLAPVDLVVAMEPSRDTTHSVRYQRGDALFYARGDVLRVHPQALVAVPKNYRIDVATYFLHGEIKGPKTAYLEVMSDWIEPITPPDASTSTLSIAPDAMQIRATQGEVQIALPSAPATMVAATDGMTIPNGTVIKTGADGTAAVLFGGVVSARLTPNSEAAVQQAVTAQTRATEVDLTSGGVFARVGTQVGVKGEFQVRTSHGTTRTAGGDSATFALPGRTDVWIEQGMVELDAPDGKPAGTATAAGTGALRVLRLPALVDPRATLTADAETLTAALNFVAMANRQTKALRDKAAGAAQLTAAEKAYLGRIKQVPSLIMVKRIDPAPPAPSAPPAVPVEAPTSHASMPSEPLNLPTAGMLLQPGPGPTSTR